MTFPYSDRSHTEPTQAVKEVLGSPDALMEIFECIESFFTRLEEYAKVLTIQTEVIKPVIVKIIVEALGIFAILTKEIKQGKTSQSITDRTSSVADRDAVTYLKKYLQRLIGRADIEGALEKLRRLTNEELMMAVAQIWKVVHRIQSGVENAMKKIEELDKKLDRKFVEAQAGTFSTSATQKCHPKPTIHTTSRPRKESS